MGKKTVDTAAENIKVLVRCRPLNDKEKDNGHKDCVELDLTAHTVSIRSISGEPDRWTFDAVINNTFSQKDIFTQFIMPLVDSVLDGFNATVFAYGQSGSGKTHTMTGALNEDGMEGIIPRSVKHIFQSMKDVLANVSTKSYSIHACFVEIYNGKVRDLLSKQQLTLDVRENKDHTFFVQGANVPEVRLPEDVIRLMDEGTERRRTGSTELNADSSRSHSIFTLVLACTETLEDGLTTSVTSKLNLVDLAGSERQGKTGATGDTLKEGCNINLSLSALGTVIDTIVKGGSHIPFRSTPLTMLLKDSLGGNSKTVMFANINPSERNLSETVSTLRFADRAKQIKNKPVVNMDSKDQKIAELSQFVNELRDRLKKYETHGTRELEEEVVRLQERIGELNVELENVRNGREADDLDFRSAQTKLEAERRDYDARIAKLMEQIEQLRNELMIAETSLNSELSQREEIFQLCTKYLIGRKKDEDYGISKITNTKELTMVLKKHAHRPTTSAEMSKLQTELQTLTVANASLKQELASLQKELEVRIRDKERAGWEAPTRETSPSPPPMGGLHSVVINEDEQKSLIAAVKEAQLQIENCLPLQQIDEQFRALSALGGAFTDDSGKEMNPYKQSLLAKTWEGDHAPEFHFSIIRSLYQLLTVMRVGWRRAHSVPMTMLLKGDRGAAQAAMNAMHANDARTSETHAAVVWRLTEEISRAYGRRNALLEHVASANEGLTSGEFRAELQAIIAENRELQEKYGALELEQARRLAEGGEGGSPLARRGPMWTAPGNAEVLDEVDEATADHHPGRIDLARVIERRGGGGGSSGSELAAQRGRIAALTETRDELYRELATQRQATTAAAKEAARLQGELREREEDFQRQIAEAQGGANETAHLTARLEERNGELAQLRSVLEIQKGIILRNNEKVDALNEELRSAKAAAANADEEHRRLCEAKDANIQQLINERVTTYMEDRIKDDKIRNKSVKKVKRKMTKLQDWITELEGMYDKKMCECEELRQTLGDQKFEQLKLVRQLNDNDTEDIEIHGHRDQIQNTLERVKEERRRRVDLFDLGEFPSAKATASQAGFCSSTSD
ncbi:unnamed protein product [Phytomonas sp. Hart1]|nr:unnamed protein product [Phytomonas sp. Hart1]|eukprot:CCW70790.1 unnamed protein product [Phytomonas sp. isolate Hart1]